MTMSILQFIQIVLTIVGVGTYLVLTTIKACKAHFKKKAEKKLAELAKKQNLDTLLEYITTTYKDNKVENLMKKI